MALQQITPRVAHAWGPNWGLSTGSALTIDAAGESLFSIGRARLAGGSGSKTISAAGGGALYFPLAAVTFANAGTSLDLGIQDVVSGLEDGTYDVSATYVGGTDTITANQWLRVVMETGTKTIAHNDEIGVGITLTARGGTDAIAITQLSTFYSSLRQLGYPTLTHDIGAGPALRAGCWTVVIEFDDGTLGWIDGLQPNIGLLGAATVAFNSGSTPDEYALVGSFPYKCTLGSIGSRIADIAAADDFELILYSSPTGTPVAERTVTFDASFIGTGNGSFIGTIAAYEIAANTTIGIAIRPTTVNNITLNYSNLQTGNSALKAFSDFASMGLYSRTNQTGAFSLVDALHVPEIWAFQTALDDGVSAGGGIGGRVIGGGF